MHEVRFYKVKDDYGNFSNFAPFYIYISGKSWPTVEHYFQACKFEDELIQEKIWRLPSAISAAKEGRKKKYPLRSDWDDIKDSVMLDALRAKFIQHPFLRKELLMTGKANIVEHTKNDYYWADGGDGSGKNMLGKLLVHVREELKSINPDPDLILPPWKAFHSIDSEDMFWRMGLGEDYLYSWSRYYMSLENKSDYRKLFPEPDSWDGFFEED